MNSHQYAIREPLKRVNLCTMYIAGPQVKHWVKEELKKIRRLVIVTGYHTDDEALWNTFYMDFNQTWSDQTQRVDATLRLANLTMEKEGGLEPYIAIFNSILAEVGWDRDQPGTVRIFKDGLPMWLTKKMLQWLDWPDEDDLEGWQALARKTLARDQEIRQEIGNAFGKNGSLTVRQNRHYTFIEPGKKGQRPQKGHQKQRDPDTMEVDTTTMERPKGKMDPEVKRKLQSEGRCFKCQKQGHISRDCLDRKGEARGQNRQPPRTRNNQGRFPSARITEVQSSDKSAKESDGEMEIKSQASEAPSKATSILARINRLTINEKSEVVDALIDKGF